MAQKRIFTQTTTLPRFPVESLCILYVQICQSSITQWKELFSTSQVHCHVKIFHHFLANIMGFTCVNTLETGDYFWTSSLNSNERNHHSLQNARSSFGSCQAHMGIQNLFSNRWKTQSWSIVLLLSIGVSPVHCFLDSAISWKKCPTFLGDNDDMQTRIIQFPNSVQPWHLLTFLSETPS